MAYEITADADNFWRAGRQWHTAPAVVEIEEFTDAQWELLEADPAITIVQLDPDDQRQPVGLGPIDVDAAQYEAAQERIRVLELHNAQLIKDNHRLTQPFAVNSTCPHCETPVRVRVPGHGTVSVTPSTPPETHPIRAERIRGAVATALEADGPELRTRTGRPVLSRVREISGLDDVTAAERDAAWAAAAP